MRDSDLRKTLRRSVVEGACYAVMVGLGEVYFVADAVRLGASSLEIGLLVALPLAVGATGPIACLRLLSHMSRKVIAIAGALGQVAVLGALVASELSKVLSPLLLIAAVCLYQISGQTIGVAWSSWFGDTVPARLRGRYFSRRNRVVHGVVLLSLIGGGLALHLLEPGSAGEVAVGSGGTGYCLLFALAALARATSALLLWRTKEPRFERAKADAASVRASLASAPIAKRIIIVAGLVMFAVYIGSPYFGPYMLEELAFTYPEYVLATTAAIGIKVVTLPAWGRVVDHHGARGPLLLALMIVALIPFPWLLAGGVGLAVAAQTVSGAAWGGHELSQFTLLLESTRASARPVVFAALSATMGAAQIAGTLVGAAILHIAGGQFLAVFAVTGALRLLVALAAPRIIPVGAGADGVGRRHVLLRLAGFRPTGGLGHRPLDTEID